MTTPSDKPLSPEELDGLELQCSRYDQEVVRRLIATLRLAWAERDELRAELVDIKAEWGTHHREVYKAGRTAEREEMLAKVESVRLDFCTACVEDLLAAIRSRK